MGAYYSRNNSYSRSYNASVAESENRLPLTRAAAHLGLSIAAFKAGLNAANIHTSEWHHVGKYANRVDYYDVSKYSEIVTSVFFWKGATNKANKDFCKNRIKAILQEILKAKFQTIVNKQVQVKHCTFKEEYELIMNEETEKNIKKGIREIFLRRAYVRKHYRCQEGVAYNSRLERISLLIDGTILDRKGKVIDPAWPIDFSKYEPKWLHDNRVQFERKNNQHA